MRQHNSSVERPPTAQIVSAIESGMKNMMTDPLAMDFAARMNGAEDLDVATRLKTFEDVIIDRIKTIQAYVKKHIGRLKQQMAQGGQIAPVTSYKDSIHNDSESIDLKIREMVRKQFEESEKKGRLKEQRLLNLELSAEDDKKSLVSTVTTLNQRFEQELTKTNHDIA